MMKYEKPTMDLVELGKKDVITLSGTPEGDVNGEIDLTSF